MEVIRVLAPILEVFVVSHPGDADGVRVAQILLERFRGNAYSGLIGGAVDVYVRSTSATGDAAGAPRALPCIEALPYGVPAPALTAIVLVAGTELAATLQKPGPWRDYVQALVDARAADPEHVGLFNVRVDPNVFDGTELGRIVGHVQGIGDGEVGTDEFRASVCRDLAQGVAQMGNDTPDQITVFVSHTKRLSSVEEKQVSDLVALVREVIADTRLNDFFDTQDIQPNTDWQLAIDAAAGTGALLAVRTDRYSSREWCQREILTAKRAGMPIVILDALTDGEERGSFVMDHVPRMPGRLEKKAWRRDDVAKALGHLVDECLKRVLWRKQRQLAAEVAFPINIDWWAPHAPEPTTLVDWLDHHPDLPALRNEPIVILHPDPPLGPDEVDVLVQIARVADLHDKIEFLTPRGLAARGG
jgi:hypothetical protein